MPTANENLMMTSKTSSPPLPRKHPLLLPVVLESVFNVNTNNDLSWSIQDLKNFRLVCKTWNEVLLSRWRSSATLRLLHNNKNVDYDENTKGIFATEFAKYLQDPNDTFQMRAKPFSKYNLIKWNVDGTDFGFKSTWNAIGPFVERLILDECKFYDFACHLFKLMIYDKAPKLKQLVLDMSDLVAIWCVQEYYDMGDSDSGSDDGNSDEENQVEETEDLKLFKLLQNVRNPNVEQLEVIEWMPFKRNESDLMENMNNWRFDAFLKTFPNLKSLKMEIMERESVAFEYRDLSTAIDHHNWLQYVELNNILLQWMESKRMNSSKPESDIHPQLKNLDVMHWNLSPGPDSLSYLVRPLMELKFPLETLSISLDEDHIIQLPKLLECYGSSLKSLKVFVPPFFPPGFYFPVGKLLNIEELELWGNVFESFSFLLEMPHLKKLKMDFGCFEKLEYMQASYEERPVYPMNLSRFLMVDDRKSLKKSRLKMEHLTVFEVDLKFPVNVVNLLTVWMPNLKSFKGILTNQTFELICKNGEKLKNLCLSYGSEVDDIGVIGGHPSGLPKEGKRLANITWLKDLKHFTLQAYCNKGKLTDLSSREGFLRMNLYSLDICVSSGFSEKEEEKLKGMICQVQVRRNYGFHGREDCCRRMEFKKKALIPREHGVRRENYLDLRKEDLMEAGDRES